MTMQSDDAKLTAYALGELDEAERAAVETRLAADAAARQMVEEIRQVAGVLRSELEAEPAPRLTELQRAALESEAAGAGDARAVRRRGRLWLRLGVSAAAAMVLVGTGLTLVMLFGGVGLRTGPPHARFKAFDRSWSNVEEFGPADPAGTPAHKGRDGLMGASYESDPELERVLGMTASPDRAMRQSAMVAMGILGATNHREVLRAMRSALKDPDPAVQRAAADALRKLGVPDAPDAEELRQAAEDWNREAYDRIVENPFRKVTDHPLSTFSVDVDTASYANVRRMLNAGQRPPKGAVRIEEMVNYFPYDYAGPHDGEEHPFAVHTHVARCPWAANHRLLRVALKGREVSPDSRPSSNFVFLLDVSGSMNRPNKLPLVKESMKMLVERLGENDTVAIAVYAGASGLVLDATHGDRKEQILAAVDRLDAGGSTNGGAGIQLAYATAERHFLKGGVNRVILCTDGDFNVGVTDRSELSRLIEDKARGGVFLSVLGYGRGNYQDARMEQLADKGNGNYAYIDTLAEARKVLVDQMTGTLVTIAKDVKIQVELNPWKVEAYRLIGYENRILAKEDFNDDRKDAGEIGAGHTVTALYEIVPAGEDAATSQVDPLRYQKPPRLTEAARSDELCTVKVRYKQPEADESTLMTYAVRDDGGRFEQAPADFRFAAAVVSFGMILRDSRYKGTCTLDAVIEQARSALGDDPFGYRAEFVQLVRRARDVVR